jgi:serine protease Do
MPYMQDVQAAAAPTEPQQKMSGNGARRQGRAWILITLLAFSAIIAFAVVRSHSNRNSVVVPELPPPREASTSGAAAASPMELSFSFREIARQIKPTVVYIQVVETVEQGRSMPEGFPFEMPSPGGPRRRPGSGSGFIVTQDGYILTNNHVVGSADRIEVRLADGRNFRARLVGTDPETDLAVIKIDSSGLPIAVLGNSDEVQQGDWVLALGSPFGLQQTLTAGIVSATGREFAGEQQFSQFIQTDASINPGNSGGPLVSMRGEVVGINTMIFSPTGGNVGIGFSVASNVARNVFDDMVRRGRVTRGYLGVVIIEVDEARARAYGVEPRSGALVAQPPQPDSPAARAGLQYGDIITAFDGKPVRAPRELTEAVAGTPVGKSARVDFIRGGQPQSVTVEVAERPTVGRDAAPAPERNDGGPTETRLGITAQTVTPEMAEQMRLTVKSGVLVRSVQTGSAAEEANLRHGDVIHRVDRFDVKTVEEFMQAIASLNRGEDVAMVIERQGRIIYTTVTLP